jgi:DNA-directed RNA polymerase sigma subunit (sigma70/sigma32)
MDRRVVRLDELPADTCSLDVAKEGGATLGRVGVVFGLTRERIRQIEAIAIRKLEMRGVHLRVFFY